MRRDLIDKTAGAVGFSADLDNLVISWPRGDDDRFATTLVRRPDQRPLGG